MFPRNTSLSAKAAEVLSFSSVIQLYTIKSEFFCRCVSTFRFQRAFFVVFSVFAIMPLPLAL